jgi:hypothetical protein
MIHFADCLTCQSAELTQKPDLGKGAGVAHAS